MHKGGVVTDDDERLLARYERWMRAAGWTERTIEQRRQMALRVLDRWPDLSQVATDDLIDWLSDLGISRRSGEPLSKWTRATYHSHVRAFFKWLTSTGVIEVNPTIAEHFVRPKPPSGRPKPLTRSEEARALVAARGNVRAWLLLALRQGLRAHEIAKIRGEDVTAEGIYVEGKGGTRATLPCHADIWALAQQYPRHGYWFPGYRGRAHIQADTVTNGVGRLFRSLGIEGSVHRARHAYATSLLRRGVNIRVVQRLMRHASLATTATYTAVDEDEMRAAVDLLGEAS